MKLILILMVVILSSVVLAEKETFSTSILITLSNNSEVSIDTESGDYSYSCGLNETRTYNKTIDIEREVEKSGCASEVSSLAKTCNDTIAIIRDDLKDSKSYSQLYTDCINSKESLVSKDTLNECTTKKDEFSTQVTTLNNDKTALSNNYNACDVERNQLKKDKENESPNYWYYAIAGIIGFVIAYWIFVGKDKVKGRREGLFGTQKIDSGKGSDYSE